MINLIDICGGVFVLLIVFLGFRRGFLSTLLGLIMVYVSAYFASGFASGASRNFASFGIDSKLAYTALFLFIFLVVYLIGEVVIWILKKVINISFLGFLDSLVAAILGGFKGLVILGIIFNLVVLFQLSPGLQKSLEESHVKKYSEEALHKTYPIVRAAIPKLEKIMSGSFEAVSSSEAVGKTVRLATSEAEKIYKEITSK